MKAHTARNRILALYDDDDVKITDYAEVEELAIGFYQKLFSLDYLWEADYENRMRQSINPVLSSEQYVYLTARVTPEDIKRVMFQMKDGKAPEPDGYLAEFFK